MVKIEKIFTQIIDPPLWRSRKTLKSREGLRGRHGGRAPIVYSGCVDNNPQCHLSFNNY